MQNSEGQISSPFDFVLHQNTSNNTKEMRLKRLNSGSQDHYLTLRSAPCSSLPARNEKSYILHQ